MEQERDEASESGSPSRLAHEEMEETYRKEQVPHGRTRRLTTRLGLVAVALLVLLAGSVLLWLFVLK